MRAPRRKREQFRTISGRIPGDADLERLSQMVTYVGSPEHKTYPSIAGPPRLRKDAAKCDPVFQGRVGEIEECLRDGIRKKLVGAPWEDGFPRYVWNYLDGTLYEGRLANSGNGAYKGYPLRTDEKPEGFPD